MDVTSSLFTAGILPADIAQQVSGKSAELCRDLMPHALSLTEAFDINDEMLSAPIARDWVQYNEGDNQGGLNCSY